MSHKLEHFERRPDLPVSDTTCIAEQRLAKFPPRLFDRSRPVRALMR